MTRPANRSLGLSDRRSDGAQAQSRGGATAADRWLLSTMMAALPRCGFAAMLWDGTTLGEQTGLRVVFRDRAALWQVARNPLVQFGDLYSAGRIEVEGDLVALLERLYRAITAGRRGRRSAWWWLWQDQRPRAGSLTGARENIHHHYNLGNDFYRLWLDDEAMQYTCAYYPTPGMTLAAAQRAKMDHVCRKVRLAPGETFVDVGCGWGGLMFHAWDRFGAIGTGINATTEQVAELRAEIARRGLDGTLQVIEADFREMPGQYDKLLSIGTLEHAGPDQLAEVVQAHANAMKPGALGVIHFIGHVGARDTEFFIRNYIFPGGWIPSLAQALGAMERCGLEVLDVENLRRHYALTLDCWGERFDRNWERIHALDPVRFDERFRRIWRTYLWSCAEVFRGKDVQLNLFQVTVSKGNVGNRYPMSRSFLYGPA